MARIIFFWQHRNERLFSLVDNWLPIYFLFVWMLDLKFKSKSESTIVGHFLYPDHRAVVSASFWMIAIFLQLNETVCSHFLRERIIHKIMNLLAICCCLVVSFMKKFSKILNMYTYISSVVEFQWWWVLKSKLFAQESTCSKETVVFWEYGEHQFVKKCQNCTFKVNFGCEKLIEFFQKKIYLRISI